MGWGAVRGVPQGDVEARAARLGRGCSRPKAVIERTLTNEHRLSLVRWALNGTRGFRPVSITNSIRPAPTLSSQEACCVHAGTGGTLWQAIVNMRNLPVSALLPSACWHARRAACGEGGGMAPSSESRVRACAGGLLSPRVCRHGRGATAGHAKRILACESVRCS